jgi:hypothetical protein
MTAAQKAARLKFNKAIAIRKKTGCTLKEAFAQVYGKKVGAVKKKSAKKKAAPKKVAKKKAAPKKVYGTKKRKPITEKAILNKIHKVKKDVDVLDEAQHKHMMGGFEDKMFKDLYNTREKIAETKKTILKLQTFKKISPSQKNIFTNKMKDYKKYLQELMVHYRELKKHI